MQKIERGQLEEKIQATRKALLDAIAPLPAEAVHQPDVVYGLSIAQLIAFLGLWQEEVNKGLREVQRRKKPTQLTRVLEKPTKFRATCVAQTKDEPIEESLVRLEDAWWQLEVRLDAFSRQDLNEPKRIKWLGNKPLWPFIAQITYEHEAQFVPTVTAFADRWVASNEASRK